MIYNCFIAHVAVFLSIAQSAYQLQPAPKVEATIGTSKVFSTAVELPANSTTQFTALGIGATLRYLVFEVHTQVEPVTLSYHSDYPSKVTDSDSGTNCGLVSLLDAFSVEATTFIHNPLNKNVSALLVVLSHGQEDPIPGGCNMEFPVEISPFLRLSVSRADVTVEFQHASKGYPRDGAQPHCDRGLSNFHYQTYVYYLNQRDYTELHYFDGISRMIDAQSIKENAHAVHGHREIPQTRALLLSYPGEGAVFNIIVRYESPDGEVREAAYVPIATYGCTWFAREKGCEQMSGGLGMVFAIVITLVGLIICFRGHRLFTFSMFFFGFLAFALMSFVLLTKYGSFSDTDRDVLTFVGGALGGILWMGFWWFLGVPVISIILSGLVFGFLLASTLLFTPFGDSYFLKSDFIYWMFLICIMLIIVILLLPVTKFLSILSCAVVGGYCSIIALDLYLKTSLSFIILNVLKRSLIEGGYHASNEVPFQANDVILSLTWATLCILGLLLQLRFERDRPPFPQSPYRNWLRERARRAGRRIAATCTCRAPQASPSAPPFRSETDPLLGGSGHTVRQYNTMPEPPPPYFND
uniref:Putative conserved plasma membrane protein n=1 Tax=Ornithodoros turicata TaxID=34597 RepID=A0A2R5LBG6_9ACAR